MLWEILLLVLGFVFHSLTFLLLARFFMQWQRVSFHNQIGRFIVATTDWMVRPLRRIIPGLLGLDLASLLPAWLLQTVFVVIDLGLRGLLRGEPLGMIAGLCCLGLVGLLNIAIYLIFAVVLMSALLSWVNPYAPAAPFFHAMAAPFLRPFRRIIPMIANVDISPMLLILVLYIALQVLGRLPVIIVSRLFMA